MYSLTYKVTTSTCDSEGKLKLYSALQMMQDCSEMWIDSDHFVGDLADKQVLEQFAKEVIAQHGHVDYLINNALPLMKGINECSYEKFQYALSVGVMAPFYLTKLFAPHFAKGAAIVNISSSRDRMSQPQTESYTAAKGGGFDSCFGGQSCRKGACKQHLARVD